MELFFCLFVFCPDLTLIKCLKPLKSLKSLCVQILKWHRRRARAAKNNIDSRIISFDGYIAGTWVFAAFGPWTPALTLSFSALWTLRQRDTGLNALEPKVLNNLPLFKKCGPRQTLSTSMLKCDQFN